MCLGCYHTLSVAWVLWVDTHERNHILSCCVSPVLHHWTRTDRDHRQGRQFSLNIILCIWKPAVCWTPPQPTAFAFLPEQQSLVGPEKRVRGGLAPQLSSALMSCTCVSDTGMIYWICSTLQSSEAWQGMSCRVHFWRFKNLLVQGSHQ